MRGTTMRTDMTRRKFLGFIGAGSAGLGGAAILSACGTSQSGTGSAAAVASATSASAAVVKPAASQAAAVPASMPGMDHGTAAQANDQSPKTTPDQMDAMDKAAIDQFLANTKNP